MALFRKKEEQPKQRTGKLPFVTVVGHEKTYGHTSVDWNPVREIAEYKSWTYACIQRIAFAIAKTPLRLYTKGAEGEDVEILEHPFLDLMKNVNDFTNSFELWTATDTFLDLTGNSYWWLPKGILGIPQSIWTIPAQWIKPIPSETRFIDGYALQPPGLGAPIRLSEEEIIHFKHPSPFDLWIGASPVQAAAYGIDLNNKSKEWGISYFDNNAQPGGILVAEDALSDKQHSRLKNMWNAMFRGPKKAGKIAVLEGGLKYQKTGSNLADMKFEDMSKSIRNEILSIFGVPASKLGLVEDVNRANAEANDYTFQKETVLPRLHLIEEKLNEKLMPMYDVKLFVKFDNPVPEDKDFRLKEQTEHIKTGYGAIDDEREKDGEDRYNFPETEAPLIGMSLIPAGEEREEEEPTEPFTEPSEDDDEKDKGKGITKSEKTKVRRWRLFNAIAEPQERVFTNAMRKYFANQHSEIMKKVNLFRSKGIKSGFDVDNIFDSDREKERLADKATPYIGAAYRSGYRLMEATIGTSFDLFDPEVLRSIDQRINDFAGNVTKTTKKFIAKELKAGLERGESVNDMASRLDKLGNLGKTRSQTIAQTEVLGAINDAQVSAAIDAGMTHKKWLTARDGKVRDTHIGMDSIEIGVYERFKVANVNGGTDQMFAPHNSMDGASAGNVINCRCTLSFNRK